MPLLLGLIGPQMLSDPSLMLLSVIKSEKSSNNMIE